MAPFPSFTKTWHTTSYPSISATNPALSSAGKNIIITGAGSGIGARTTRSFAEAGASHIAILGRREVNLNSVKAALESDFPAVTITAYPVDITDKKAVDIVFSDFTVKAGKIDVLVSNAGYGALDPLIKDVDTNSWLAALDVNIKGPLFVATAFLRSCKEDAVVVNVSSGFSFLLGPQVSAYAVSKAAAVRFFDILGMENPKLRVVNVHPGVVETEMTERSGMPTQDDASLPADFILWLSGPHADFLKGRYVFSNWDVDEMKERRQEVLQGDLLKVWLLGLPLE
ncbi:hypothetical protein B0J11DRAFT_599377 [Dendryphion nanum]|uniref:NAD(P)-binding protein n=1 Tax=Dendryphion nanum TaxID=256645 RepID=A0A9P9D0C3_9PLEO|nr:hypothetical protein B0J11DRAFT_599377 [Dendryphion nanum]